MECFRRHRRRRSGETCYTHVCIIHYGYTATSGHVHLCVCACRTGHTRDRVLCNRNYVCLCRHATGDLLIPAHDPIVTLIRINGTVIVIDHSVDRRIR